MREGWTEAPPRRVKRSVLPWVIAAAACVVAIVLLLIFAEPWAQQWALP